MVEAGTFTEDSEVPGLGFGRIAGRFFRNTKMISNIVARLQQSSSDMRPSQITAKNAEEAGKALEYFSKLFGKPIGKEASNETLGGKPQEGEVYFNRIDKWPNSINDIALRLEDNKLRFSAFVETPYLDNLSKSAKVDERRIVIYARTAEQLIQKFEKELKSRIRNQTIDIVEDQRSLKFLKSLMK